MPDPINLINFFKKLALIGLTREDKRDIIIPFSTRAKIFLSSSMAEHSAVNRRVVGSSPTWGATSADFDKKSAFSFCLQETEGKAEQAVDAAELGCLQKNCPRSGRIAL